MPGHFFEQTDASIDMRPSTPTARNTGLIWTEPTVESENDSYIPLIESNIDGSVLSVNVSYSMDLCAQVTAVIHDPDFRYARNNYFWVTRDVWYRSHSIVTLAPYNQNTSYLTQLMEIGSAKLGPSTGAGAQWTCEMRTKAIQQMKRGRGEEDGHSGVAGEIAGSGHVYVQNAAARYGLRAFIEETDKTFDIKAFASGEDGTESTSVWDAVKGVAGMANFACFEADGILFFTSHQQLLGAWGTQRDEQEFLNSETNKRESREMSYIPAQWPRNPNDIIQILSMPTVSKSDNDPFEVQGSMVVDRTNGTSLRPGMTIQLRGIPMFGPIPGGASQSSGLYLISSVNFDHLGNKPVKVTFRSPTRRRNYVRQLPVGATKIEPMQSSAGGTGRSGLPSGGYRAFVGPTG